MTDCLLGSGQDRPAGYGSLSTSEEVAASETADAAALSSSDDLAVDEKMRRRLKYFFMTPCEKYQAKDRLPWKLLLQLLKVLVVTLQLYVFGMEASGQVYFLSTTKTAFRHLYLQSWDASWETPPYPPSHGPYAVYTYNGFYSALDYALRGYNATNGASVGAFASSNRTLAPQLCVQHYTNLTVDAASFRYVLDRQVATRCFWMLPVETNDTAGGGWKYDSRRLLLSQGFALNFDSVLLAELQFYVNAIHFNFGQPRLSAAECFLFNITIEFDNKAHTGQLLVGLNSDPVELPCSVERQFGPSDKSVSYTFLDVSVILVCALSLVSCVRSLYKGNRMRQRTQRYFLEQLGYQLNLEEQFDFINLWFVLIIVNDLLTLIGSLMKILIEYKTFTSYTVCGLFLASGAMLVWFGTLRYLGYFSKYNVLLRTIKRSLPDIGRFLVCAIILFLAFSLFGWITFGPYHVKFRTFFSSLECLFALVNGDDIFTTYALIPATTNAYIYIVSRIYLYAFISLFIYIVLNVCISIILEAYESVTRCGGRSAPSRMWTFIAECSDPASSQAYRADADAAAVVSGGGKPPVALSALGWLSRWFQASLVSRVNNNNASSAANGCINGVVVANGNGSCHCEVVEHCEDPDAAPAASSTLCRRRRRRRRRHCRRRLRAMMEQQQLPSPSGSLDEEDDEDEDEAAADNGGSGDSSEGSSCSSDGTDVLLGSDAAAAVRCQQSLAS